MLLTLVSPALALSIPVRASYREVVVPGETALASRSATAAVTSLTNPTTGATFTVTPSELTANKREASGAGTVTFGARPGEGTRTWAVWFLDGDGGELGEPEVVDLSFDADGYGSIAARDAGSRLASLAVTPGEASGAASVTVTVQDSGARAAYLGFVEITDAGASALATDPDLTVLDAAAYAAFQGLGLEALVPLDLYTLQLEGVAQVAGLSVATSGVVEGGADLAWGVDFYTGRAACEKGWGCEPEVADSATWLEAIGAVKKKGTVPRVTLNAADLLVESTDASLALTLQGDVRDLEVSAAIDVFLENGGQLSRDVVALDPGGFGVQAKAKDKDDDEDTGFIVDIFIDVDTDIIEDDNQAPPPPWTAMAGEIYDVVVLDSAGRQVSSHPCQMNPTAGTLAGTSGGAGVLVGECTYEEGGVEVRRLQAAIGRAGWVRWTMDLGGAAFTQESTVTSCEKGGGCSTITTSVLGGTVELQRDGEALMTRTLEVTETDFDLPFVFDGDVDGLRAALALQIFTPTAATWSVLDGVATATFGEDSIRFDVEDVAVEPAAECGLLGPAKVAATVGEGASFLELDFTAGTNPKLRCRTRAP